MTDTDMILQASAYLRCAEKSPHDLALWYATGLQEQFERLAPDLPDTEQAHVQQAHDMTMRIIDWLRKVRV